MTRIERIAASFVKTMKLIEIGASYSPIIPKKDGWNTTVVDHANRAELVAKYHDQTIDNIEDVDFVWHDGTLADAIPKHLHGSFDGLIASHVGEHMPDLIGFLTSAAQILKLNGVLFLALPDKRLCFDFFQPLTTTGALLDGMGRSRHSRGTLFDHAAYMAHRGGNGAWFGGGPVVPFSLAHSWETTKGSVNLDNNMVSGDYVDSHKWHFTPSSFTLLILELNLLGMIPWAISKIEPTNAIEFYVWLERRPLQLSAEEIASQRLQLLEATVIEIKQQVAMLEAQPVAPAQPSISAIIPLYNGERFIEQALRSMFAQTVPPKEIIVVDDGSKDGGANIVRELSREYPITLLTKLNGGQSSARNFGVAHSTGDLIALLDQDDIWYPHHLEKLIEPFLEPQIGADLGWVYSDLDEVDTNGMMINHSFLRTLPTEHPKRNLFVCLREDMFILPSASLIARKAFDAVGGFDERLSGYEDDDLFLRLFRHGYTNIFLEMALSKWRIYPDSYSYSYRMRRSRAIYVRKLLATYPDDPKRARFIHRDLILPRFYVHAVAEYRNAVASGDMARMDETREELLFLVEKQQFMRRRILGKALSMMKSPRVAQMLYSVRHIARPVFRRLV